MRTPFLLLSSLLCCVSAQAAPANISWSGWTVSSSEELSEGVKYSLNGETPSYPLPLMFDNDPATAWVFSATSKEWFPDYFKSRYGIRIEPEQKLSLDGLRIMNGQNASQARFSANDRVTQIRVHLKLSNKTTTHTFNLPDSMGWHTISFPKTKVDIVTLEFVGIKKGSGPKNDLCISGLALLSDGKKIDLNMPKAVMYYDGLEGCGVPYLICGQGRELDGIAADAGYGEEWSPNGRYVAGFNGGGGREGKSYVWVADATQAKILRKIYFEDADYKWLNSKLLRVGPIREDGSTGKTRVLKFP